MKAVVYYVARRVLINELISASITISHSCLIGLFCVIDALLLIFPLRAFTRNPFHKLRDSHAPAPAPPDLIIILSVCCT